MPNAKLKHYLHLHFLVIIAGFTAILGELITIGAIELVWYRMAMAGILMFIYIKVVQVNIKITKTSLLQFSAAGVIIALHWITFFEAINQANVSIALAMFSSGAFFASFIEPLIFKRRILGYEIIFGIIVILGVYLITSSEMGYINGIILGLLSALFSTLFAVINGLFITKHNATVISFYEFVSGVLFLTVFILCTGKTFNAEFFTLSNSDWMYLFILASVCTAYAFIGSVDIMRYISPFTVILSYNLEPVYGIAIALALFPETEKMSPQFYIGAILVLMTVLFDAIFKNYKRQKRKSNSITN
ncbi:DMT family transporter [Winogradskyella sediminis]|uniref:EamA-like transporter family protein n=1 Tax=Winogradskyella sediminis TaxID=1382466 RepID=A0A1H1MCG5_9FLAO|nr:DMT family transporter [Winogradskyella sediminis]REG84586.1 EamA-like transporter family protein [Winogradskyella sediminis]SDR84534.1 EamA-like transporter family protein [Winogradskyella sediminis]